MLNYNVEQNQETWRYQGTKVWNRVGIKTCCDWIPNFVKLTDMLDKCLHFTYIGWH